MKTKRIDFNIDLAKKIQAGKAQGRIVTRDGLTARVICWDRKEDDYPIVALFDCYEYECVETYSTNGSKNIDKKSCDDLFLEVPDDTPEFSPFDRVLVPDDGLWRCAFYSHYDPDNEWHICTDGYFHEHCIPYEGNEHLVGTTDEPKEDKE